MSEIFALAPEGRWAGSLRPDGSIVGFPVPSGHWPERVPQNDRPRPKDAYPHVLAGPYRFWYRLFMREAGSAKPILAVRFFATTSGNEPVREWLARLDRDGRRAAQDSVDCLGTLFRGRP